MAKVTYTGEPYVDAEGNEVDTVTHRGVVFTIGKAADIDDDHAAALADNPFFDVAAKAKKKAADK